MNATEHSSTFESAQIYTAPRNPYESAEHSEARHAACRIMIGTAFLVFWPPRHKYIAKFYTPRRNKSLKKIKHQ